jgi:branched-chain amino acid transport system permease protein
MMLYLQNATGGLAAGAIYGLLALSLVIVYRSTGVVNFAAGEIGTFTTFISWELLEPDHLPFWVALLITAGIAAVIGVAVYALVIRQARRMPEFVTVMLTFGLYEIFNGLSNSLWSPSPRAFPAPWSGTPFQLGDVIISRQNVGNFVVALIVMGILAATFRFTKIGLGLRATTDNVYAARVVGITPGRMYVLGWALASVVGAIAGMLVANLLLLSPGMMGNVLVFSLVAVILGGLESPIGAIIGSLLVGVVTGVLAGVPGVGPNLSTPVMLLLVIAVLLVRPQGLLGQVKARKL